MAGTETWQDGVLRERWNDATSTFTAWDETGAQVEQRAYTPEEAAAAATRAADATAAANALAVDTALASAMTALQTIIGDTNANINANPAQRIKDIAQALKRVIRAVRKQYDASN